MSAADVRAPYVDGAAAARVTDIVVPRAALFLDRDGVINVDTGYVHTPESTKWLPGIFERVRDAWRDGRIPIVITNQAGIARGYYDEAQFLAYTAWVHGQFRARGAPLVATYYCPHHPEAGIGPLRTLCTCRKPAAGMLERAIADWEIDPLRSTLVGDKASDVAAGRAARVAELHLLGGGA